MASRLELHEELCEVLGSRNVYFQPPASVRLKYPCFVYSKPVPNIIYADNKAYNMTDEYIIQAISSDPDNDLARRLIVHFKMIRETRSFVVDNLYHDNLILYY